jgi:uncharacterized protein YbjT (DUF2867 family)
MITICGATGKIGGTAARALRARGLAVRAVVRDTSRANTLTDQGCELAVADLHDADALRHAFRDSSAVLAIVPLSPMADDVEADAQQTIEALGSALERARPGAVVAISDYGAHVPSGTGVTMILRRLEQRLAPLSTTRTFVRSAEHMQNWARQLRPIRARGVIASLHQPVTRAFPTVSAFDVGEVAAELLALPPSAASAPRILHVEGPTRYSAADIARVFEQQLGQTVNAIELPRDQWESTLRAGMGASYALLVAALQDAHNAGLIDVEPGGEVRRGTTDLTTAIGALPQLHA